MKFLVLIICVLSVSVVLADNDGRLTCKTAPTEYATEWISMVDPCVNKMTAQVNAELNAAMTYLAMGAYFSRDSINRPGFAKTFFHSAYEEREHAIKILDYLLMRGEIIGDRRNVTLKPTPVATEWKNGEDALRAALALEHSVTNMIRDIIQVCEDGKRPDKRQPRENFNDYHLVDYLTGEFLEEQYTGQRVLAGHISTLGKLMIAHGPMGEFLFDKQLLGEVVA